MILDADDVRNPVYTADGVKIDCEINHPEFGWIAFTADPDDDVSHGPAIHQYCLDIGPASYNPPTIEYGSVDDALDAMTAWIEAFVAPLTAGVPRGEIDSWTVKSASAQAYVAGIATPVQAGLIEVEAQVTGEDPTELAELILKKAEVYYAVTAYIAGFRRKLTAQIEAVTDPSEYTAILQAGEQEARLAAQNLGLDLEG